MKLANRFFEDLDNYMNMGFSETLTKDRSIKEENNTVTITLDIPGVEKSDLKISIENSRLNIDGKRSDKDYVYSYKYLLNSSIDTEKISANLKNGVLTIILNKKHSTKVIEIT